MSFYPNEEVSEYNKRIDQVLQYAPEEGIVISAESEESWEILWKIMMQFIEPKRWREPSFDASIGICRHAIHISGSSIADQNADAGWSDVDWYKQSIGYNDSAFYTFSEVFVSSVLPDIASAFDEAIRW